MKPNHVLLTVCTVVLISSAAARAEIQVLVEKNSRSEATSSFKFKSIPPPSRTDTATRARFSIVDGEADGNGADLSALHDGKAPSEEDEPSANFFFNAGTEGGRVVIDLGEPFELTAIHAFSWHPNTRGPQVYRLYASDGQASDFNPRPRSSIQPETVGWKSLAKVDTRSESGEGGGQYAVRISDSGGVLGTYRHLLFDIVRTEATDDFGNTFYSEIDVLTKGDAAATTSTASEAQVIPTADGNCEIKLDTSGAPELKEWAEQKLGPALAEWYPKIVSMLPSEGFTAPTNFSVTLRPGRGVAATGGTRITANVAWLSRELSRPQGGEAVGAIIHEAVHVVQQYGRSRREAGATRPPGWLVEGIPDYIRWFKFEPQSHGADIVWLRRQRNADPRYDASYRVSANFLDWVTEKYDTEIVKALNAALRQGKYGPALWKERTGHEVQELGEEWKAVVTRQMASTDGPSGGGADPESAPPLMNALTAAEKAAGWKLLFNGKDFSGWHNFKREGVRPGWEVKDGALVCADPHNAGDLVTVEQFDWFELQIDYNISPGGNSGIMYHVTEEGGAPWATGPEFQLEDNQAAADPVRCGWLYALYQPPNDPKTGKPIDATKSAGEWNHVRLLLTPARCEHEINGVKYFDYVLGSEDFTNRVAKSKFSRMPKFAKSNSGFIALQGDHGQVSFRNIKLRPIPAAK